jgi:hypothetical protein
LVCSLSSGGKNRGPAQKEGGMLLYQLAILAQRKANAEIELNLTLNGIIALAAGILILIFPKILNYIVAIYLIVVGLVDIFDVRL